ncbi:MAG: gluconeogenesis factor YvcK family protein [Ezakiella sp.]|nr:YvcK family protein [Ezakiella sp.]MDD7761697.1 YvcK family protein [Bacillota bacterium]MDY3946997.1 gluconeogenesis factor YvcK family protein [Ezakiella sp.]
MKKLVAIGGGTGLSVLLSGLKDYFDVTAVVTVGDNGGGSGILRADLNMLPPGDIRNCLLALSEAPEELKKLLSHRFSSGALNGQSLGNLMIAGMSESLGSFEDGVGFLSSVLNIKGEVYPVSSNLMNLVADLSNGDRIYGESEIAIFSLKRKARILDIFLNEPCTLSLGAKKAILSSETITLGPGSLYTSVICNLLVDEMRELLKNKKIIYVANVMTQPEETYNYSLKDHVSEIERYLDRPIDFIFANVEKPSAQLEERYRLEGSIAVIPTEDEITFFGDRLIMGAFLDEKLGYIRSDAKRIAQKISEL